MVSNGGKADIADEDGVFFVSVGYKGTTYQVPVQSEDTVACIFDFIQDALDFPRENCKLIVRGKMIRPDHDSMSVGDARLSAGSKLMLVASSAHDVSFVQSSRPDPLVKGFAEEARDELSRQKRTQAAANQSAWGTKQDAEYRFGSIKAEFKYSTPSPFDAEKLLQKLATDPGIIDIMKSRSFKVGVLTEMSPDEAQRRMANRGTPDMDLLGYNQNAGDMIVLKLRTDNKKGFRPYHDLVNTLIHEMTHNVWGPHDQKFWKLYGELKAQYMRFHRFWSHGGKAANGNSSEHFEGFARAVDNNGESGGEGFGQVLGGGDDYDGTPRSRAVIAAEARAARAAMGSGPGDMGVPNFLAMDGTWTFMCPCGQVHDPAACAVAQAAASDDTEVDAAKKEAIDASGSDAVEGMDVDRTNVGAVIEGIRDGSGDVDMVDAAAAESSGEVEDNGRGISAKVSTTTDDAKQMVVEDAQEDRKQDAVMVDALATGLGARMEAPSDVADAPVALAAILAAQQWTCPACTLVNAADAAVCNACDGARLPATVDADPTMTDAAPALDLSELGSQGLDGASLWLQSFAKKLNSFSSAGAGRAHDAIELLLRLLCNVITNPAEKKFRRIRTDNPKIRAGLLDISAEAEALIMMLGFEAISEDGGRVLQLRDAVFDVVRLRMGKEVLEGELDRLRVQVVK